MVIKPGVSCVGRDPGHPVLMSVWEDLAWRDHANPRPLKTELTCCLTSVWKGKPINFTVFDGRPGGKNIRTK